LAAAVFKIFGRFVFISQRQKMENICFRSEALEENSFYPKTEYQEIFFQYRFSFDSKRTLNGRITALPQQQID